VNLFQMYRPARSTEEPDNNGLAFSTRSDNLIALMPKPPSCNSLGKHCREIKLTVRVSDLEEESQTMQDASVTWISGHTQRMTFGQAYTADDELRVDATVHVPCKYLETLDGRPAVQPNGMPATGLNGKRPIVLCAAHRFRGPLPQGTQDPPDERHAVQLGDDAFSVYFKGKRDNLKLRLKRAAKRALPVLQSDNPCIDAPCRTGDNVKSAACCRDLTLELFLPDNHTWTEALLRSRKAPYLCKVKREDDDTAECEVISTCGFLDVDGITCTLHDRVLPNGQRAKPSLCYEWPEFDDDETGHPGCRLI